MRIISGGQTGADRAALDFAIEREIPHGGWCPKGRLAEDGVIDERYKLRESSTRNYPQRTEQNILDSDGTIIFTISPKLTGGCKKTASLAQKHQKPWIHLHARPYDCAGVVSTFIGANRIQTLNIAGSRASKEPEVYQFVQSTLAKVFPRSQRLDWTVRNTAPPVS